MAPARAALKRRDPWARPLATRRTLVVIPAKDEASSLPDVLARLAPHHAPAATLVVDDGSVDQTARLARAAGCRVVQHPFNLGYGAALLTGYVYALHHGFEYVVQLDADGQHPPEAIGELLAPMFEGRADVVLGSRWLSADTEPQGWRRKLAARFLAWLATTWMRQPITDPTSGFLALSPAALALLCSDGFPEDYPDLDVLIYLHRAGLRLREVPVAMARRRVGHSMHGGTRVLYYFYRLGVCLLLLPWRRSSPYRVQWTRSP